MKVRINVVGEHRGTDIEWPEGWPVPVEGQEIQIPNGTIFIRQVVWYPLGEDDSVEPFIYVVVGPKNRL